MKRVGGDEKFSSLILDNAYRKLSLQMQEHFNSRTSRLVILLWYAFSVYTKFSLPIEVSCFQELKERCKPIYEKKTVKKL